MMTKREIAIMRGKWEAEAREAAIQGNREMWAYRIAGIAALDLVLGDISKMASRRIPFPNA